MDGVINVLKPAGPTSHDVVDRVRRIYGQKRVGHAGTLDPMATGVLVVCLGKATRIVEYLAATEKQYRATIVLGIRTDTQDSTGAVVGESDASGITLTALEDAAARFVGDIEQVPPMISALKHQGKPLYKHAREGKTIERTARRVTVHSLEVIDFRPGVRAEADLIVTCSSGTYIRTLCADIGDALGCGAMMSRLERTRVGVFKLEDAVVLEDLEHAPESHLLSVADALRDMAAVELDSEGKWRILHGLQAGLAEPHAPGSIVKMVSAGSLLGIGVIGEEGTSVRPRKVLAEPEDRADE